MNPSYTTNGLKSLFQYPLQGKEWGRKMLYLGLFWLAGAIIPVIPWLFSLGYFAEIVRRFAQNEADLGLPEWTDWNRILMDGLRVLVGLVIFSLPLTIIYLIGISFYLGSTFATIGLSESGQDWLSFLTISSGMSVFFCTLAMGWLLSVGFGIVSAPAITHMVIQKDFTALFRVKEWWPVLRANLGGYLIAFFIVLGLGFVFQLATQMVIFSVVLCGLLPVLMAVAAPYLTVIIGVVFGQAYQEGHEKLAQDRVDEIPEIGD